MNNLPKVVTQRCLEQDLNPRPTDRKPKCLTVAPPLTSSQLNLPHGTKQKRVMKKLKTKKRRRNGPVVRSVESVLRLEGSLWGERFVEEVGLEPGVKGRVMDVESGELTE